MLRMHGYSMLDQFILRVCIIYSWLTMNFYVGIYAWRAMQYLIHALLCVCGEHVLVSCSCKHHSALGIHKQLIIKVSAYN
jgi:hypothetical protein